MAAQLRYYMHIEPDDLTDEEFGARYNELLYIREKEKEANKA